MITLVTLYPDLMNIYGDYANVLLLQKRLTCAGQQVTLKSFTVGDDIDLTGCDLLYIGAGTEKSMLFALADLFRHKSPLWHFAKAGGNMLLTGNALGLFANTLTDWDHTVHAGLGLLDIEITLIARRRYAEFILQTKLISQPVIGAVNSSIEVTESATPLFSIEYKTGQTALDKTEGVYTGNLLATQLTGPLLVRNPALLDAVAARVCPAVLEPCTEPWRLYAEQGYQSALATLQKEKSLRR